jgi:hypothetical protein
VLFVGVPLLWLTAGFMRAIASWERWLADALLGLPTPYTVPLLPKASHWTQHFRLQMREGGRFKVILYFILKLPVAVINWSITIALVTTSCTLIVGPIVSMVNGENWFDLPWEMYEPIGAFLTGMLGLVLGILSLPLLHVLAQIWGRFTQWCLRNSI